MGMSTVHLPTLSGPTWSRHPIVKNELERLRNESELNRGLSRQEKRNFLARVVRANPLEIDPDDPNDPNADLIDSIVKNYDKDGNLIKTTVKLVSKAQALEMDNKMTWHNAPEQIEHRLSGGVMLIPVGRVDSLEDWEGAAKNQQNGLKEGVIDCELLD